MQVARKGDVGKYPGTNWHTGRRGTGHMYTCIHTHLAHRPCRGQDTGRHTQAFTFDLRLYIIQKWHSARNSYITDDITVFLLIWC